MWPLHFAQGVTKQWKYSAARQFANCRVSNQKQKHNKRNSLSLHPQQEELLFFLRAREWKRPPLLGLAWAYVISHVPKAQTTVCCETTKMFCFSAGDQQRSPKEEAQKWHLILPLKKNPTNKQTNKQNPDEKQGYLSLNVLNTYKSTCTLRKSAWACQPLHPGWKLHWLSQRWKSVPQVQPSIL